MCLDEKQDTKLTVNARLQNKGLMSGVHLLEDNYDICVPKKKNQSVCFPTNMNNHKT